MAHRDDANDKLDKAQSRQSQFAFDYQVANDEVGFVDRDHNFISYRFPFDPQISSLADIIHRRGNGLDLLNATDRVSVLAYKPLRRAVVRKQSAIGKHVVIRMYSRDEYSRTRRTNKIVAETKWQKAKLIDHSDRHGYVVTEWLDGLPLATQSIDRDACRRAAAWLAEMQRTAHPKLHNVGHNELCSRLQSAVSDITNLLPDQVDAVNLIQRKLVSAFDQNTDCPVFSHGDFYAEQLIQNGESLSAVDWDDACNAPSGMDPGNFIAHLEWQAARRDSNEKLESKSFDKIESFAHAYEVAVAAIGPNAAKTTNGATRPSNSLSTFVAFGILRLATQSFRRCEPDWRKVAMRMIQRAEFWMRQSPTIGQPPLAPAQEQKITATLQGSIDSHIGNAIPKWLSPALHVREMHSRLSLNSDFRLENAKVLRYVADRRCVINYDLIDADGTRTSVIGKVRAKGLDVRAMNALNAIHRNHKTIERDQDPVFAKTLGAVPDWNIWFQSHIGGRPADQLLPPDADSNLAYRIGVALGRMHVRLVRIDREHTLQDEIEILEKGLSLCRKRPRWKSDLQRLYGACRTLIESLPAHPATGIHRDFYPAQVLCTGKQIGFVDCDLLAMGHPAIDVANFVAHLRETALRKYENPDATEHHEKAFEEGYRSVLPLEETSFRVLRLASLARHISICNRIPERKPFRKPMLDYCLNQLELTR